MTIKELKQVLLKYPDNLEVEVSVCGMITPIVNVGYITNLETNLVSRKVRLNIAGYDREKFKEEFYY